MWRIWVGAGLLALTSAALYPSWRLMLVYLGGTVVWLIFQQARFEGSPRHWGHFFVLFIAASWLVGTR